MTITERSDSTQQQQEPERLATVVIGAGQTGLATAYFLGRAGVPCVVLDEHQRVGDQWRHRYDSLLLNTPAQYDGLPGLPFPAPRGSFPTGAEMGDHLERYVATMGLTVRCGVGVRAVERRPDGRYLLTTTSGDLLADDVVVACGAETTPRVPAFAAELDPGIRQLHSSGYHGPAQLLPGPVLVVGGGQSGADIALEIVRSGHETWLSGRAMPEVPVPFGSRRMRMGLPVLWFMANHVLTVRTPMGRRMQPAVRQGGAPLLRVRRADLAAAGVHLTEERTVGVDDGRPVLADGTVLDVANVVWCTGFRQDFGLVQPDVTGEDGYPRGAGGIVEDLPGLYYVGLLFQTAFSSMLIGGAGRDARRVAAHIAARARR
ncbi:MAG TPA: NAD(P)-binding domain-containing protein [Blastococcus sp.]|nr:NAD(P)-binding domain-containing protein [Blastococcus sp.]